MHVTHLDDHALALYLAPAFESYPASKRLRMKEPTCRSALLGTFRSYSAPSRLRKEVPPQAAALRGTSPLAAFSIPPCTTRRGETEVLATGAPGRRNEQRHLSRDS